MGRLFLAILVCLTAAGPARPGAWLRDAGSGFLSLSATARRSDSTIGSETGVYAEYGLRRHLTIGLDANDRAGISGHALAFLRLPLTRPANRLSAAMELAAGGHHQAGVWRPMVRATASLGRGFETRWGNGWANLDAAYARRLGTGPPAFKFEATLGLSNGPGVWPLLQLETYHARGQPLLWTLTPSLRIGGRKGRSWVIGIERKSPPDRSIGIRIALWRSF